MAESSNSNSDVEMASTPPAVNADNVPAAPAGPDSVSTGTKRTLEMNGESPPDERPQRRAFRREAEEAIEPNASVPVARERVKTYEDLIEEAKDNKSNNEMTHEEIEELLDYRPPNWADEEENISVLDAVLGIDRLLYPPGPKIRNLTLQFWKVCIASFHETPDFLFSGHIGLQNPGERVLEDLVGDVPYPGPSSKHLPDLVVLLNQPMWAGKVNFFRAVMAFAVACRTADTRKFPYLFNVNCVVLSRMGDSREELPIWKSLMQVDTGDAVRTTQDLLLREIVRLTQPPDIDMPTPSTEWGTYEVTMHDTRTVLSALNGIADTPDGPRHVMPTEIASDYANKFKCKRNAPAMDQLKDRRRKSLLRHMYLKQQYEAGEEDIYKQGFLLQHCRKQLNKERQQSDEASDNWPGDFAEAESPAAVQPENEVKEETPEPSYADIEIDPDLRVKREPM